MPISSPSTTLYTIGRGVLSIGEWTGDTPPTDPSGYTDVGNCPRFEVEVTEEKLDHYSSRSGTRLKDKSVILETGYTINFDLDEISVANMKMFLKATLSGSNVLLANTVLDREFAVKFVGDNPAGPNEKWQFWRVQLSPGGAFGLIADEWSVMSFTGEGLSDTANNPTSPFFTVTYATTTTTV
jgi:hypothetical protein